MNRAYRQAPSSLFLDPWHPLDAVDELDEFDALDELDDFDELDEFDDFDELDEFDLLSPPSTKKPTLKRGSRGAAVVDLQRRLTSKGFPLVADGIFGPRTQAAVRSFQRSRNLVVDGIVGPQTWGALLGGTPTKTCNPYVSEFQRAAKTAGVPSTWAKNSALCQLVKHESGWNPAAKNPRSTAFGLFQFLQSTWKRFLPEVPYKTVSPYWQAVGGFRYIRASYRTPERAWAFWQATVRKNPSLAPPDLQAKARLWIAKGYGGY